MCIRDRHKPHGIRKNPWDDPIYRAKQLARGWDYLHTPAARAAHDAQMKTPESKAKRSVVSKEIQAKPEVKAKNSDAHKGKKLTLEHRAKISENTRNMSMEQRAKIAIHFIGRKLSADTIAKITTSSTGRKHLSLIHI